jgi:hypothetical protein
MLYSTIKGSAATLPRHSSAGLLRGAWSHRLGYDWLLKDPAAPVTVPCGDDLVPTDR